MPRTRAKRCRLHIAALFCACLLAACSGDDAERKQAQQEDTGADGVLDANASPDTDSGADSGDSGDDATDAASQEPQLIDISALEYVGGFHVPSGEFGDSSRPATTAASVTNVSKRATRTRAEATAPTTLTTTTSTTGCGTSRSWLPS